MCLQACPQAKGGKMQNDMKEDIEDWTYTLCEAGFDNWTYTLREAGFESWTCTLREAGSKIEDSCNALQCSG